MSLTTSILLLVPVALQAWLATILMRRGLHRIFRFFFAYTVFSVGSNLLKFVVQGSYTTYFYAYWMAEPFYAVLGLGAMFEVLPLTFKSFSRLWQFRFVVFAIVVLMVLLGVLHALFVPIVQPGPLTRITYPLEIGIRYVQSGVFLLLMVLAGLYRIRLRRYVFGIAFGFGLVAASYLAAALVRSEFGTRFKFVFTFMPGVVYVIAVLIWLLTFLRPEPPDPMDELKSPLRPQEIVERVRRLSRIFKGQRDDSNLLASTAPRTGGSRIHRSQAPPWPSAANDH